jgi:hypothetical protein
MQFFSRGYKRLKVFVCIFHSLDWFQVFMTCTHCIHNNILQKIIILLLLLFYNPKFKKLRSGYDCFGYMLVWLHIVLLLVFLIQKMVGYSPCLGWVGHPIHFTSYEAHSTTSWFKAPGPQPPTRWGCWFGPIRGTNLNLLHFDQLWRKCERSR